jgi:transketolase
MRQTALNTVYEMAQKDSRIVFIGSDLGSGTLEKMKAEFPLRFYMEGISEQYLIGMAAGLAKEGYIPYLNTISTFFTRRAFEQIAIDLALHNLPVRILASGGGMVYAPLGPTHTSIEDFSLMQSIPGIKIFSPADSIEMKNLLLETVEDPQPLYIRFGKGGEPIVTDADSSSVYTPKVFGDSASELLICTTGVILQEALKAREILNAQGIPLEIWHFPYLGGTSDPVVLNRYKDYKCILVVEEHIPIGGLFTNLLHLFNKNKLDSRSLHQVSLPFKYSHNYGNQADHLEFNGLDAAGISSRLSEILRLSH